MSRRNIACLIMTMVSLGFLIPGLSMPILSIDIGAKLPLVGELSLHHTKQSILGTIRSLFENDNTLVAFLILLFSIVVPLIKGIAVLVALMSRNVKARATTSTILDLIGKWSMADVFIVAIFISFLSTSSEDNIDASIHIGFYYFLLYCLLSIVAFQLFRPDQSKIIPQK